MTTAQFEQLRQATFESQARDFLERLDPETGLIRSQKYKGKGSIHTLAAGYDVRAMATAACAWAVTGRHEPAWRALQFVLDNQDRNRNSRTYGNYRWHSEWEYALDPNAVAFITPLLWYLDKQAGERMPSALRGQLHESMRLAFDGIQGHVCTFLYTNIVMLNFASRLCIADTLDWERPRVLCGSIWEEWRNRIGNLGVMPEYNSLTYTAVDIYGLAVMLACPAPDGLHDEARMLMRHFIAHAVADFHPAIGRITGPMSRAYPNDRRLRGGSYMDSILHFVLGTPPPAGRNLDLWVGVPIGPEDVLPEVRDLPLPRTTTVRGAGQCRTNHLGKTFALGSVDGRGKWTGHSVPFFLAFESATPRCGLPVMPEEAAQVENLASDQRDGSLLAMAEWLIDRREGCRAPRARNFSGMNCGLPDNLQGPDFRPGFNIELGPVGDARFTGGDGRPLDAAASAVAGSVLVVTTDSVHAGFRFFADGQPELTLATAEDGELTLTVLGTREGIPVTEREQAVMAGFLLEVVPVSDLSAAALAADLAGRHLECRREEAAWQAQSPSINGPLAVTMDARPAHFYAVPGFTVTANRWAMSMRGSDR